MINELKIDKIIKMQVESFSQMLKTEYADWEKKSPKEKTYIIILEQLMLVYAHTQYSSEKKQHAKLDAKIIFKLFDKIDNGEL